MLTYKFGGNTNTQIIVDGISHNDSFTLWYIIHTKGPE